MDPAKLSGKESSTIDAARHSDIAKPDVDQNETAIDNYSVDNGRMSAVGMLDVFSKPQVLLTWVGVMLMVVMNYLNVSTLFTFSIYALSDFSRAAAEGTLGTIFGVVAIAVQIPMALAVNHFHDFDVLVVVTLLSILASAVEAATPSFGGFAAGFALNIVSGMSARYLSFYFSAELSSLRFRTLALNISQLPMFISFLGGSPIAEAILEGLGWRWGYGIFCIIAPVSTILLLAMLFIFRRKTATRTSPSEVSKASAFLREFNDQDWAGMVLLVSACGLLLLPIPLETRGVEYYDTAAVVAPTIVGASLLIVFIIWETKLAKNPVFDHRLLKNRTVLGCFAATIFCYASQQFSIVYMYSYIFVASDVSISEASYIANSGAIVSCVIGLFIGAWISWTKRGKWPLIVCNTIFVLGSVIQYVFIDPHAHKVAVIFSQILLGVGWAGIVTALSIAQAIMRKEDMPVLTALSFISANFGGGFASCISGGLWTSLLLKYLEEELPPALKSQAADLMGSIVSATDYKWGTLERDAIAAAYRHAFRMQALGAMIAAIICFLACLPIENIVLERDDDDATEEDGKKGSAHANEKDDMA